MAKFKTDTIDGRKFEIEVTDSGSFQTIHDGEIVIAPTLKALQEKLRRIVRSEKVRLAIPCTMITEHWNSDKIEIKDIELTGIHGSNDNVLYREGSKGSTQQLRSHSDHIYQRLSPEEKLELKRLEKVKHAAIKEFDAYKEKRRVNPRALIDAAQNDAVKEPA